ncbi:TetR/AcrR family transcriptional regulator [Nocardioides pacificus]
MMSSDGATTRAEEAVRRSLRRRQDAAEAEVARLIEAGRDLLGAGGEPKVAEIVKTAKVSIDAFYRYFGSKDEFVAAVAEDGAARAVDYVAAKMAEASTPQARLRAAVAALMSQASKPELAAASRNILGRSGARVQTPTGRQSFASRLAAQLAQTLEELGASDASRDATLATHALVGVLEGFVWSDTSPTDEDIDHAARFVLNAVRPG